MAKDLVGALSGIFGMGGDEDEDEEEEDGEFEGDGEDEDEDEDAMVRSPISSPLPSCLLFTLPLVPSFRVSSLPSPSFRTSTSPKSPPLVAVPARAPASPVMPLSRRTVMVKEKATKRRARKTRRTSRWSSKSTTVQSS